MVYIQKGEGGPYDRLLSEGPSLAAVEERSHNGLLLEGPYRPRCGQLIHRERLRTMSRRSKQEFYKEIGYLTLMNSMRASLNNTRSVQVRCIFHTMRKVLKKLASVKSFCSLSLQT